MLYQPAKINTQVGTRNTSIGIGIITPEGAYLTSAVPPLQRIAMTAFIPRNTIFKRANGNLEVLHVNKDNIKGKYPIPVQIKPSSMSMFSVDYLPKRSLNINIAAVKETEYDIHITEDSPGVFSIKVQTNIGNYIQPASGWVWKG